MTNFRILYIYIGSHYKGLQTYTGNLVWNWDTVFIGSKPILLFYTYIFFWYLLSLISSIFKYVSNYLFLISLCMLHFFFAKDCPLNIQYILLYNKDTFWIVVSGHSTAVGHRENRPSNCIFHLLLCFQKCQCQSESKINILLSKLV